MCTRDHTGTQATIEFGCFETVGVDKALEGEAHLGHRASVAGVGAPTVIERYNRPHTFFYPAPPFYDIKVCPFEFDGRTGDAGREPGWAEG